MSDELERIKKQLETVHKDHTDLMDKYSKVKDFLGNQGDAITEMKGDIKAIEHDVTTMKDNFDVMQAYLQNCDQRVSSLEKSSTSVVDIPSAYPAETTPRYEISDKHLLYQYNPFNNQEGNYYYASPNQGGYFESPRLIVIHYTAGRSFENTLQLFQSPDSSASCHVLIGKRASVAQLVRFNERSWCCGQSVWQGRGSVNGFSLSIEFDNYGKLVQQIDRYTTWFGTYLHRNQVSNVGGYSWEKYPRIQIETGAWIVRAMIDKYSSIRHVVGHSVISPDRKIDPGLAFPWEKFERLVDRSDIEFVAEL